MGRVRFSTRRRRPQRTSISRSVCETFRLPICFDRCGFFFVLGLLWFDLCVENGERKDGETEEAEGERESGRREGILIEIFSHILFQSLYDFDCSDLSDIYLIL